MASGEARGLRAGPAAERPGLGLGTVLMSCQVWEGGGRRSALRLQLSMERPGDFRLGWRRGGGSNSLGLYELNLKDVVYEFKSATCHGISMRNQPANQLVCHFDDEEEAQRWSTIITSSLREVEKASSMVGAQSQSPPPPAVGKGSCESGVDTHRASPDIPKPGTDLAHTEDLVLQLTQAIEAGDCTLTAECAVTLAQQRACLAISLKELSYPSQPISLRVGVEDASSSATIVLKVFPYATIYTLKQQVFREFGFHPGVQRWIVGQCLAADHRTLSSYGVRRDRDPAFLYLLSSKLAGLSRQQYEEDQAQAIMADGEPLTHVLRRASLLLHEKWNCSTLPASKGGALATSREGRPDLSNAALCLDLESTSHQPAVSQETRSQLQQQTSPTHQAAQKGWACVQCTYINKPNRPGCEMCSSPRPQDYPVPEEYALNDEELCRMLQEKEELLRTQQEQEEERLRNYQQLLQTDGQHLVPNLQPADCPVCLNTLGPQEGVVLRDCLHTYCRECLKQLIRMSVEPEVACPYRDSSYACESKLQEREIRALVSAEDYNKFLDRSVSVAESSSDNSYHCRTPDCRGWCIYEDAVNEFHCPSCRKLNCLLCKAIHTGMNCKQYQDDVQSRAANDSNAHCTSEMLKSLVQTGEAMHCPRCGIVVQKKGGCDWIRCPVCHTEICWVTKGCRWGPGGPGDTSGGCRCLVNGQRCHALCQNCH
ncbi:ranBP-type and C3HC4-type zinc finger-containing protein 1 [Leucoraja erinacea]|uniref:ranBP-type and C3HC4-type zinc finger-containing protein 1 n=1 Tax=Leucoraja erinaceus TaxID=7782 RepID=UPI0024573EBF|nr:ranBP-type and C3HC4-type zinc finger-containing protein 1 [Leucoraja erinacea]